MFLLVFIKFNTNNIQMQIGLRKNGNEGFYYRDEDRKNVLLT